MSIERLIDRAWFEHKRDTPHETAGLHKGFFAAGFRAAIRFLLGGSALREALEKAKGCFDAAVAEGLHDRLAEASEADAGSLPDLVRRRLLFAPNHIDEALVALGTPAPDVGFALTPEIIRVLTILRDEWWCERSYSANDLPGARLLAAVTLAFKADIHTRQKCNCEPEGERLGCDECLDESDVPRVLAQAGALLYGAAEVDRMGRIVLKQPEQAAS